MEKIIDLTNDAGFETLVSMIKEGSLSRLNQDTDIDLLIQKQAYADANTFADEHNKLFSIASPIEAYLSARYAEKCASELDDHVIGRINEACDVFNIDIQVTKVASKVEPNEMFETEDFENVEKYASCTDYGTEFESAMAARALNLPDYAEQYEDLAKMASEVPASTMINVLREVDAETGADLPWVASRVGTPEYAVFEKRSSDLTVDLGTKQVEFEKLAELQEAMNDLGIDIDFDANDAYTTKIAIERLPLKVRTTLASMV